MGKPIALQRGKRYLIARCPKCGDIVDAISDPGAKRSKEAEAGWVINCTDCGSDTLDLNKIEAETWFGVNRQPPQRR